MKVCALATGLADKAVSLLYEGVLHARTSPVWIDRCRMQIADVLTVLNADLAGRAGVHWFGDSIGHADIAVACAVRFTREAHPDLFEPLRWPSLERHSAHCEATEPFRRLSQVLKPPGRD